MTVIDEAIALEERARRTYTDAARSMRDPSAKEILSLLAREEEKHAAALEELKKGEFRELPASSLLRDVRGIMEGATKRGQGVISQDASLREVLARAMDMERATERFYRDHAAQASDKRLRDLFGLLAHAEEGHYLLCSSLAEYFDRPAAWVESAEFGRRPDY